MGKVLSNLALTVVEVILIEAVFAVEIAAVIKISEKSKNRVNSKLDVI